MTSSTYLRNIRASVAIVAYSKRNIEVKYCFHLVYTFNYSSELYKKHLSLTLVLVKTNIPYFASLFYAGHFTVKLS